MVGGSASVIPRCVQMAILLLAILQHHIPYWKLYGNATRPRWLRKLGHILIFHLLSIYGYC